METCTQCGIAKSEIISAFQALIWTVQDLTYPKQNCQDCTADAATGMQNLCINCELVFAVEQAKKVLPDIC